tara:strand:- start:99 stop:512 length:414 start_codon:yes stop_codon:yes gene_type:complete
MSELRKKNKIVKDTKVKLAYSLSIEGIYWFIKLKTNSPTKPELPLSISQNELLNVICKNVHPKIRYRIRNNNLKIIFFSSFSKINFKPHEIKVIKIKNEIRPKLCNKKSEILLPKIPKKFFISELDSPYTSEGSDGE